MINISDIIQGKFIEEFSAISMGDMLVAIALSFVLSLYIVFIYRITYAGVSFSAAFAGCVIMLSMVTTVVILVISSNVVLSLGMVGALSIVRFRTAIKEPTDTGFLFWAIATGIICGAGYVTVSILATLLLGLLFVGIHAFGSKQKSGSFLVVVRYSPESRVEEKILTLPGYRLKNKSMNAEFTELVAEIRLTGGSTQAVDALREEAGVMEVSLMRSVNGSTL